MRLRFKDFNSDNVVLERLFTPEQEQFWKCDKKTIVLNGGMGSGKTEPLILRTIFECINQPDNYFLLGRKTYQEIYDVLFKDFCDLCPPSWIVKKVSSPHPSVVLHTAKKGVTSTVIFRHLDTISESEIKGLNLGGFGIDQAEEVTEAVVTGLIMRLRRKGIKYRMFFTKNPALDWIYKKIKEGKDPDWIQINMPTTSNYVNLPIETVTNYERFKETDLGYYRQYVLGIEDESLLAENSVFSRDHVAKLINMEKKPLRVKEDLEIFAEYELGHRYQMGVDVSEGSSGGDEGAITIVDLTQEEEVASWSGRVPPDVLADMAYKFSRWYGGRECMIVPEMNSIGLALVNKLRNEEDVRIYIRQEYDKVSKKMTDKIGWRTTASSKALLISRFQERLRLSKPKIYSEKTLSQFSSFVWTSESRKSGAGAQTGYNDDRLISSLLAFWTKGNILSSSISSPSEAKPVLNIINGKIKMDFRDVFLKPKINKWTT